MKTFNFFTCFILLFFLGFTVSAQNNNKERLNLPGDNLNLYAVMKLFQESETLEGFERNLNAEDSRINNLDLNGDDRIDYIKVIDYPDGNDHTIVLQVAVNARENQDVAVFTVQKDGNQVQIQLIGDQDLYGRDYIIEPNYADNGSQTPNPGYTGNSNPTGNNVVVTRTTTVEIATWPIIRFMFMPSYVVWRSPWYWNYYPSYWSPWRPFYWDYYYGYHSHWNHYYYGHYRPWHHHRYAHWNDHYYNKHRSHSNIVYQRRENGSYRNTYSRPDTRKEGSADYNRRYSNNNRSDNRQNINSSGSRINDNNRGTRQGGINRNEGRGNQQGNRQNVDRQPRSQDVNRSQGKSVDNNRNTKQGVSRTERRGKDQPSNHQSVSRQSERRDAGRQGNRSDVNNKSSQRNDNKSSVRSGRSQSVSKQSASRQSSGSARGGNSREKQSNRR